MFCTSVRRRPSFAPGIGLFAPMGIRENQLTTHDIEIPFGSSVDATIGRGISVRHLRILLLSTSAVSDAKLNHTLERISHFASLTGGEDIAIIFLLYPLETTNFITAKQLNEGSTDTDTTQGTLAYSKLRMELFGREDIPLVPILLLSKLEYLPNLLKSHIASLSRQPTPRSPATTCIELLKLCTANPPMSQQTAFVLSDLFTDLRDLAEACATSSTAADSDPSSGAPTTSQLLDNNRWARGRSSPVSSDTGTSKLKRLRDLVGEQECQEIIDFWRNEWVIG